MTGSPEFEINETRYEWCVRAFSLVRQRLGINIKVHDADDHFEAGQIFVFNHFARFETIIPQYLIHQATGAVCRCVAASELFKGNDALARFLWSVGAVPNDHPGLLAFLAAEILRGRKVIFFPEGGMIKDRRVIDDAGEFNIVSPSTQRAAQAPPGCCSDRADPGNLQEAHPFGARSGRHAPAAPLGARAAAGEHRLPGRRSEADRRCSCPPTSPSIRSIPATTSSARAPSCSAASSTAAPRKSC